MRIKVDEKIAEAAVLGGSFFGGGGGGDPKLGLKRAKLALELGEVELISIDSVPKDTYIATVSLVGAPAAKEKYVTPAHEVRSTELFIKLSGVNLGGLISSENGGYSTINGWIQSAVLEIPVVDAPADGRAHPTGIMGSMGLHRLPDYVSIQVAVGGNPKSGRYIEMFIKGSLESTSRMVREAAVQAGGLVAVTRNPVPPDYVKQNAAPGAITQAIEVGKIIREYSSDPETMINKIINYLGGGEIIDKGKVIEVSLETTGGFDYGRIVVKGNSNKLYEALFWNEFIMLNDEDGKIYGVFPDLIVMINIHLGLPMTSAEVKNGDEVFLLTIPREKILLGAGVKDPDILKSVEDVIKNIKATKH